MRVRWYKSFNSHENSLMEKEKIGRNDILICWQNEEMRYAKFDNYMYFYTHFVKEKEYYRTFNEIILANKYQKPYFDIDIKDEFTYQEAKVLVDKLRELIKKLLPQISDEDILIFDSSKIGEKISFHIVVDRFCFISSAENKIFCRRVLDFLSEEERSVIDDQLYKSVQNFRIFGCHKHSSSRVKKISDMSLWKFKGEYSTEFNKALLIFGSTLITNCSECSVIEGFDAPKIVREIELDIELSEAEEAILEDILENKLQGAFSIIKVEGNCINLKRISPSMCITCHREHEAENAFIRIEGEEKNLIFRCRRTDDKTYLGKLLPQLKVAVAEPPPPSVETGKRKKGSINSMKSLNRPKDTDPERRISTAVELNEVAKRL